jgi:hypothetical protein
VFSNAGSGRIEKRGDLRQEFDGGKSNMSWYRVYFLASAGDIRNADEFDVVGDEVALMLADSIHDAVSDLYAGYEVWQDNRLVFRRPNPNSPRPCIPDPVITQRMQVELLRRAIILQKSDTAFARSCRLAERIHQLQGVVGSLRSRKAGYRGSLHERKRA